ncbi:hypothetical protein C2G38_1197060 [Gigaspora rosea]|uniref:Uncharacterized protein n=1 Tax=Gigaspora rosea TaxID=44941 RepID=A0A397VEH6_9GLOM|nr:hypothetical protein C2G38_1197060 [Gigaspora rosea]
MILPRRARQPSFYDEYIQKLKTIKFIYIRSLVYIFALLIFSFHVVSDSVVHNILKDHTVYKYNYGLERAKHVFRVLYLCMLVCQACHLITFWCYRREWCLTYYIWILIYDISSVCQNIIISLQYLRDQILGNDYPISCNTEPLDSWTLKFCSQYKYLIILSWLSLFVWFIEHLICLLIALVILGRRIHENLKLWIVYQYQYKKGLLLTYLKERKEKPTNLLNQNNTEINNRVEITIQ